MMHRKGQRGVALFTAIFLVVVIALVASVVALTTTTQQVGAARALQAERAYYAAIARIDEAIPEILATGECQSEGERNGEPFGFDTDLTCDSIEVQEGGNTYNVFTLIARASSGSLDSGTLVRRSLRTQFSDL